MNKSVQAVWHSMHHILANLALKNVFLISHRILLLLNTMQILLFTRCTHYHGLTAFMHIVQKLGDESQSCNGGNITWNVDKIIIENYVELYLYYTSQINCSVNIVQRINLGKR